MATRVFMFTWLWLSFFTAVAAMAQTGATRATTAKTRLPSTTPMPHEVAALTTVTPPRAPEWKVEGWIEGGYTGSSTRASNLPYGFDLRADDLGLNQAWLGLEHPLVKERPGRRAGLRFDMFVGSDPIFTRARGLFPNQTSEIGFDPIQFYVEGHVDGIRRGTDVRIGRFASPIGQEYNAGPSNLLPSHSYSFIYDPFTHTGVFAQTTLDDDWTLLNGIVTGSDIFVDPAMRPTYINGGRYVDHRDSKKAVQVVTILGPGRFDVDHGFNHINLIDLCVNRPISRRLQFLGHAVHGWEDAVPGLGDVDWSGIVAYLNFTFSDSLAATLRLEYFDDGEGNRTGFAGEYRTSTLGFTWKPERWLTVRPELRFDDHDGAAPFEGRNHLTTATLNGYVKW